MRLATPRGHLVLEEQVRRDGHDGPIALIQLRGGAIVERDEMRGRAVDGQGTAGDDVISGTGGDDIIYPGAGNDRITLFGGNNRVHYESGHDVIRSEGAHQSPAFFGLLDKVMPDWERRKQRLERDMA